MRRTTGLYKAGFGDRHASVYADRDWVTPLRISPQTCSGASYSTLFLHRWSDELEAFPVGGRWTWIRVHSVHAYLLVTFDCFFFSSGLIGGTVITTTGILFARGRFAMEETGPSFAYSAPLAGTFLRLSLDLASDQLCDIPPEIPNIMGLRALRASAAIVKVMSVPDSRCIHVVAADDHVNIGFHG